MKTRCKLIDVSHCFTTSVGAFEGSQGAPELAKVRFSDVLLTLALHALHVLHQQVFPCQLVVVQEVVHVLVRLQVHLVEGTVDPVLVGPEDVPLLCRCLSS